jgi:hypothetical protein
MTTALQTGLGFASAVIPLLSLACPPGTVATLLSRGVIIGQPFMT